MTPEEKKKLNRKDGRIAILLAGMSGYAVFGPHPAMLVLVVWMTAATVLFRIIIALL